MPTVSPGSDYIIGELVSATNLDNGSAIRSVLPSVIIAGSDGVALSTSGGGVPTASAALPAGTDRSGTANTSSATLAAANTSRRGLNIQNIGANNIGINEFGGTAAIGTAGTYTLAPGASINVRTNRLITAIAATGATAYTATEY